jgi:chloride channel 3/4/5
MICADRLFHVSVVNLTQCSFLAVMTAKWVGDGLGKDGIYSVWIAMRRYPWLPPLDYHDRGETGAHIMKPFDRLIVIEDEEYTALELGGSGPLLG